MSPRAKNVEIQATLEEAELIPVMRAARSRGPLAFALTAWCYEFGARVTEPGMQLIKDTDLRLNRARPMHLKRGKVQAWHPLMPFCREALPLWLAERATWDLLSEQRAYLFPSRIKTGRCYTCKGVGARLKLKRDGVRRFQDGTTTRCDQCGGTGKRWGLAAPETYKIVHGVLVAAGIPDGRNHPHVLRHSIITHLLNAGVALKVVQDRVGHRRADTTLEYMRVTQRALDELEMKTAGLYEGWILK